MNNKSSIFPLLAALVTAWAIAGIPAAAQAGAAGRPDLTGQWQLNRDSSDDAQAKFAGMGGGGGHTVAADSRCSWTRDGDIRGLLLNAPTR
jgi:hypothetical protein